MDNIIPCGYFDGNICVHVLGRNYGKDCDCIPDECDVYDNGLSN